MPDNMCENHIRRWLLGLVRRGYEEPSSHTISVDGTQIVIDRRGNDVAICCVGSNEPADWIRNFDVRKIFAWEFPGEVHRGFLRAFSVIRAPLDYEIRQGDCHIHIVGHSLGGALAPLVAYHLSARRGLDVRTVLTLGAPRVGVGEWRDGYDSRLGDRTSRHVHAGDPVPMLPPALLGYRHVGQAVFYAADGKKLGPVVGLAQQWARSIWAWLRHKLRGRIDFASDDYHAWELYLERMWNKK